MATVTQIRALTCKAHEAYKAVEADLDRLGITLLTTAVLQDNYVAIYFNHAGHSIMTAVLPLGFKDRGPSGWVAVNLGIPPVTFMDWRECIIAVIQKPKALRDYNVLQLAALQGVLERDVQSGGK